MKNLKNILPVLPFLLMINVFLLVGVDLCLGDTAATEKKPLWEVGLFGSVMTFPHYPGSDEDMSYVVALPYLVYRGDKFRMSREGMEGIFFKTERLQSTISLSGYPPVSGETEARAGMPDLGALFGIGPELKWYLWSRNEVNSLYIATAVHAVSSIDVDSGLTMAYEGIKYGASLIYRNRTLIREKGSSFGFSAGTYYGDSGLHAYLYDVDTQYARADRLSYQSDRGHSGHSLFGYLTYGLTDVLAVGVFGRWDNVRHAVFNDSPLVRQDDNYTGGIYLIWKVYQSKTLVEVD